MVNSISSSAALATTAKEGFSKADGAANKFSADFNSFLKIFVTQLENQDPLKPQDSSAFTGQIAQFSTVEQSVQTNKNLEEILSVFKNDNNANIVSYSGKFVEVTGDTVTLAKDGGEVTFTYTLDDPARQAFVTVYDQENNVVYNGDGITDVGENRITWAGKDNEGNPASAGKYRVKVNIIDQEGNNQDIDTIVKGKVEGVSLDGVPTLLVNGKSILLENIRFVGEA